MDDLLGLGKVSDNGLEVLKTIYPDLLQPGFKKVGLALETVLDFANTALMPLKLRNEKIKINFEKHLNNLQEKMNEYPEEQIGTVPPEIGVPIMDQLLRTTNDDLADLFVNLLVNASLVDNSRYAHPSFINILGSLSADEAKIINYLISNSDPITFIRFGRQSLNGNMIIDMTDNISNIDNLVEIQFKDNKGFYMDNLVKLGIFIPRDNYYSHMEPIYKAHREELESVISQIKRGLYDINLEEDKKGNHQIFYEKWGHYEITDLGEMFLKSITKN
ncbi:DUF4393 domain-containing protein [Neobacillus citreus]|uniref:DUF4393 domain-containing protein n=1 Tax=Neobacillus citreus TaxID=2833578 RepID=A0A942YC71_9BACI|nr:DUF4393 domain-containing protein [Neobacillus citreus]MCH6267196.1 DUF4393 domain-containing protein [Neobacillus citreus]